MSAGTMRFVAGLVVLYLLSVFAMWAKLNFWSLYAVFAATRLSLWAAIAKIHFENVPGRKLWAFSLLATLVNSGIDALMVSTQSIGFC